MSDYVFNYTNTPSSSFVVKPYTVNGPMTPTVTTPYVNAVSGVHAIAINTPLALVGKGITDYGQVVQNNLLYLAENFCSPTPPIPPMIGMLWYKSNNSLPAGATYPAARGLYLWSGSAWLAVVTNGEMQVELNANNRRVINVADAVLDTDALTTNSANLRYLKLSGGTLTGNLVLAPTRTVKVQTAPVATDDVTNKLYVDAADLILQNNIEDVADDLTAEVTSINGQIATLYPKTGGQISGNVTITGNLTLSAASNLTLTPGSGIVDFSNHTIQNVGDPVYAHDAAHKDYVDTTIANEIANLIIPPASEADGVVSAASLNETTGVLTLTRTQGLPAIVTAGLFASRSHNHNSSIITYDPAQNQNNSILSSGGTTINNVQTALVRLDRAVSNVSLNPTRTVIEQTVAGNNTFVFEDQYTYDVWSDSLMVFMNGIKQYCDTRAEVYIQLNGAGGYVPVGIPAGTYPISFTVDSVPHTVDVVVTAGMTYYMLYSAIVSAIDSSSLPVSCAYHQFDEDATMTFVHHDSGTGHSLTMSVSAGDLFYEIPVASSPVPEAGYTYAYREIGIAGDPSTTIEFHNPPPVGSLIEIIILS